MGGLQPHEAAQHGWQPVHARGAREVRQLPQLVGATEVERRWRQHERRRRELFVDEDVAGGHGDAADRKTDEVGKALAVATGHPGHERLVGERASDQRLDGVELSGFCELDPVGHR